ncbi:ATP-binding cassette sub-family G member 2-like [Octopus vulgaris]|uniref:ATP-binding cassette sub-family G member 2-like n=1 Tax=Octopus vulgaris TaxID=6645 RepID=A0AA36AQE5_OCTVU|nr:ATP-binding cassette sub-family G member 2-like [Octopus vulgaris]
MSAISLRPEAYHYVGSLKRKLSYQIFRSGIFPSGMNAIMGPTGSGKSSLLNVISGQKNPAGLSGTLLINGRLPPVNFKCKVGYVEQVGSELIRGISGGERKRTCIGLELITSPQILFLDEPTTGLDSSTAYSVMHLLKNLTETTAIIEEEFEEYCKTSSLKRHVREPYRASFFRQLEIVSIRALKNLWRNPEASSLLSLSDKSVQSNCG